VVRILFDNAETEVPSGARLMDVCDELHAPVAFSCRDANCGTCVVEVPRGGELLSNATKSERDVLHLAGAREGCRLACQARIVADRGVIRIRAKT
jgi:ferredoxin